MKDRFGETIENSDISIIQGEVDKLEKLDVPIDYIIYGASYTSIDAATAIVLVLLKGKVGIAYNAADEATYCSIADMAKRIAGHSGIQVEFDVQDNAKNGFPETIYMNLDTTLLRDWLVSFVWC